MSIITKCFAGLYGILQDPPSTLALICLLCITLVVIHNPAAWPALASFATVMPGILAYTLHKVTLAQLASQAQTNLPPRGQ